MHEPLLDGIKYAGADWLIQSLRATNKPLPSKFGERVANLLGQVYRGLYHLPWTMLRRVDWTDPHYIQCWVRGELATHDGYELTGLVVLAHEMGIRVAVQVHSTRYLRLSFTQRTCRVGSFAYRHPTLERHIEAIRGAIGGTAIQTLEQTPCDRCGVLLGVHGGEGQVCG